MKEIAIEYSVYLENGAQVESNVGREPLVFSPGEQMVLPALEEAVTDMEIGQSKKIVLAPEDAYGIRIPDAIREVGKDIVPEEFLYEGAVLVIPDEDEEVLIRVDKVNEETVLLDFNHPLAGHALTIDVTLIDAK